MCTIQSCSNSFSTVISQWNVNAVVLLTSSEFQKILGGDQVVAALLSSWEENEPCYVENMLTQFPSLPTVSDVLQMSSTAGLAFGRDIVVTTGDADLEFGMQALTIFFLERDRRLTCKRWYTGNQCLICHDCMERYAWEYKCPSDS